MSEKFSDDESKARMRRELVDAWNTRYERTCEMELQTCIDPDGNIFSFVCSECGVDAYGHVDIGYCPNCGAKVVSE